MYGTLTTYDLLATKLQYPNTKLVDIGEEQAYLGMQRLLAAHNEQVREIFSDFATFTTSRDAIYGGGEIGRMTEVDEAGTAKPSKAAQGSVVGFPLKRYERAMQGTKKWFERATVGELVGQTAAIRDDDRFNMLRELKRAIYTPTNYTADDYLTDHRSSPPLAVKALANADSMPIPPGPNGEIFDASTHTHYLGTSSFVASDLVAAKETVLEHFNTGSFQIQIARGQEAAIRAMTPNFVAALPMGIVGPNTANQIPGTRLMTVPTADRLIGEFDGIPVVVKPWAISGYIVVVNIAEPVLRIRVEEGFQGAGDLVLDAQFEHHPFRSMTYSREFGIGVYYRVGASVLDTGHASYTAPAI